MLCPNYEQLVKIARLCFTEIERPSVRLGSPDHDTTLRFQQLDFDPGSDHEDNANLHPPLSPRSDVYKVRDLERQLSEPAVLSEVEFLLHETPRVVLL